MTKLPPGAGEDAANSQEEVIRFLSDPAVFGSGVERVETVETHVSRVFLGGERVLKLKRAVTFPYLDFSTPEKRRRACEAEVRINRRTAPGIYRWHAVDRALDAGPTRRNDGSRSRPALTFRTRGARALRATA